MNRYISKSRYLLAALSLFAVSCQDDFPELDYTIEGEDVELTVPLSLPKMDVESRANIDDDINRVETLWIATYSATSKQRTTDEPDGWLQLEPGTNSTEFTDKKVTLKTKSGSSYIVAVANVDNMAIDKTDETMTPKPLRELLAAADTWDKFLNIAVVSPSTYDEVHSPEVPLVMVGAYTNIAAGKPHNPLRPLSDWQTENFQSYTIAASSTGKFTIEGTGAIHLRRLVSHINFQVIPGTGVKVTPNSYRIVNVPKYSWLYERDSEHDPDNKANFGDYVVSKEKSSDYYSDPTQFSGVAFYNLTAEQLEDDYKDGSFGFDFWQAENKHTGSGCNDYKDREREHKEDISGDTRPSKENTGIFTSLSGEIWTPNNMATYVVLNCTVEYKDKLNVDDEGADAKGAGTDVSRVGIGDYYVHLGCINDDFNDFNCYRNTNYTYRLTINGLEDVRLEAWTNETRPDVEGMISDILNPTVYLDCHYHSYNVYLTDDDLKAWDGKSGFGFIMYTYDNGQEKVVRETTYPDGIIPADELKYVNWVELRPTTDEGVLAMYKPNDGSAYDDGKTFNLVEASRGEIRNGDPRHSANGWYTIFVNEYTYEEENANEEKKDADGRPKWMRYVMQNPRRFYLRVTQSISHDGESTYARSKYAGVQQSILTYYSLEADKVTVKGEGAILSESAVEGSAVGVERTNESFGLNLRRSYVGPKDDTNGRYNIDQYLKSKDKNLSWFSFIAGDEKAWTTYPQEIHLGKTGYDEARTVANHNPEKLPRLKNFQDMGGSLTGSGTNSPGNNLVNVPTVYDVQPEASAVRDDYIEAINACMNRNRDNNGNGVIDREEIRWYVPTLAKYLRMILGNKTLGTGALMDYSQISDLKDATGKYNDDAKVGKYIFFGSEGRVLWAMQGVSTSNWCQWGSESPVAPWQVRCIRTLGTDLKAEIGTDKTIPAYTYVPTQPGDIYRGGIVTSSYYDITNNRTQYLSTNGEDGMRVHTVDDRTYNSLYYKFEISPGKTQHQGYDTGGNPRLTFWYDAMSGRGIDLLETKTLIDGNPCKDAYPNESGWRVPNIKEVAIMKNLHLFDDMVSFDSSAGYVLSCTFSAFNSSSGKREGIMPFVGSHKVLVARNDGLTMVDISEGGHTNPFYFIRCVRDVR